MKIDVTKELIADLDTHAERASAGTEAPDSERLKMRAAIRAGWVMHPSSDIVAVHVDEGSFRVEHADGNIRAFSPTFGQPAPEPPAEIEMPIETIDEPPIEVIESETEDAPTQS